MSTLPTTDSFDESASASRPFHTSSSAVGIKSSILPRPTSPESSEYVIEPKSPISYLSTEVDKDPVAAILCVNVTV